jgi:DNA polymerase sigma
MTAQDHRLLAALAKAIRDEFAGAQVSAFGSRANNTATPESDLDVCVVLDQFQPNQRLRISDIAWELGFNADVVISTIIFTREQFEHGPCSASPLVHAILTKGVAA